jgi:hypothetical protein
MSKYELSYTTKTSVIVDTILICRGLEAYKRISRIEKTGNSRLSAETVVTTDHQGITDKEGLKALEGGFLPPQPQNSPLTPFFVASDSLLINSKRFGLSYANLDKDTFESLNNDRIYDHLKYGGSSNNIVRLNREDNSLWDVEGRLIPTGIYFNYLMGHMNNGCYDLDKALEILIQRSDIIFAFATGEPTKQNVLPQMHQVPYYNTSPSCATMLNFYWTPSQEQAEYIYQHAPFEQHACVFEQDMLGLRAGDAALFYSYYKSSEESNGKSLEHQGNRR